MTEQVTFLSGSLSQLLPICPRPAVWRAVATTVPSGGLLFDSRSRVKRLVESTDSSHSKTLPTKSVFLIVTKIKLITLAIRFLI